MKKRKKRGTTVKIEVIGTGNIGRTLGVKWALAGHAVTFGIRQMNDKAQRCLDESDGKATAVSVNEAIQKSDIILLAIPGKAVAAFLLENNDGLNGKTIIDATNNVGSEVMNNIETIQNATSDTSVYRAFSSLGWENFANPQIDGEKLALLYCGPEENRGEIAKLIEAIGLDPIYLGDEGQASLIDSMTRVWFALAFGQGYGRRFGFKLVQEHKPGSQSP
ncbi:MAG: NAD(P)-binding domain-containing protein [Chloroflexota bacterium]